MKLKSRVVKWLTGYNPDTFTALQTVLQNQIVQQAPGLSDIYLFDFKNWSSQYNGNFMGGGDVITAGGLAPVVMGEPNNSNSSLPTKIKIKPIDVLAELETIPTPFTLTLIDEKIDILKDKAKLIVQYYAKREIEALIVRLENRKKYLEFKAFFDRYQNTTDEKIDILLKKYDLVMKTSDIFVPEFPDDAIATMKSYTEQMEALCGKKTIFYVIAEPGDFKKAYEKRDPILLAQSPFGFYWQILGAWDKEMLLLGEL